MAKKKKTNAETKALRREIEALKAQLKQEGIEPSPIKQESADREITYADVKQTKKVNKKASNKTSTITIDEDPTYLLKDMKKTAVFSFFIISAIVVVNILNFF